MSRSNFMRSFAGTCLVVWIAGCQSHADSVCEADPTCTLARDCAARCYLDSVGNVCAPNAAELSAASDCTQSCRP
jgi:hypothetical protein